MAENRFLNAEHKTEGLARELRELLLTELEEVRCRDPDRLAAVVR